MSAISVDFEEIRKATENFSDKKVIGTGGFGTVYKGELSRTSMAIKVLKEVIITYVMVPYTLYKKAPSITPF